ncbi:MAG: hypothetical protein SNJ79_14180, partial [Sphingomonadaceae bacterium]
MDTDVRFRTIYYFRTFDLCWSNDAATPNGSYRRIVPGTDTVYRFRMTGKAPSGLSTLRFESGVLPAAAIDPFGTSVRYDANADAILPRSADSLFAEGQERRLRAIEGEEREALRVRADALAAAYDQVPEAMKPALKEQYDALVRAYAAAPGAITNTLPSATSPDFQASLSALEARYAVLQKLASAAQMDQGRRAAIETEMHALLKQIAG